MTQVQQGVLWLMLHLLIGSVANAAPLVPAVLIAAVVGLAVLFSLRDRNKRGYLHLAACYLCAFEILTRLVRSPVPWEIGRYAGIPLLFLGIVMGRKLKFMIPGLVLLACVTPSLVLTDFSRDPRSTLVFNWAGVLTLALSVAYFNRRLLFESDVLWILRCIAGPVVAVAVASVVKTPDLSDIEFSLSNTRAAAGFGSNQIATVFGMGIVALALGFLMNRPLFGLPWIDFFVTVYIFFRTLLSLSRGGLLSALFAVVAALAVILWAHHRNQQMGQTIRIRRLLFVPLLVPILALVFVVADQVTGGVLSQRYRGETEGTLAGQREKTLITATSGRSEIIRTDLEMWYDHLIMGVGPGNSAVMRPKYGYPSVAPHTEYSRLLSEHGIFGLIFTAMIVFIPLRMAFDPGQPVLGRAILAAFAFFSLTVMAHSATRLFGTTMLYGIGWALILPRSVLLRIAIRHPELRERLTRAIGGPDRRELPEAIR